MIVDLELGQQDIPLALKIFGLDHHQELIERTQGFPYFQWFLCTEGRGELVLNNQRMIVYENHGMLIYPNEPYSMKGLTEEWRVHFFGFSGSLCAPFVKSLNMLESGVYFFSDPKVFEKYIHEFYQQYKCDEDKRPNEFSKACYGCLLDLSQGIARIHSSESYRGNEVIKKTVAYLELNYSHSISLNELADHVHLSKEYLCSLFKEAMGQTIMTFLLYIRIARSRIFLLQYPEKKVKEIAFMCGFESPSYFCMVFKKIVGTSPDNYRLL